MATFSNVGFTTDSFCSKTQAACTSGRDAEDELSTDQKRPNHPVSPTGAGQNKHLNKTPPLLPRKNYLFVRIYINPAFNTLLSIIRPRIARHPFSFALRTFVLAETSLPSLIWRFDFTLRSSLYRSLLVKL